MRPRGFGAGSTFSVSAPPSRTAAIPTHFSEPSGQYASGQWAEGTVLPASSVR